MSDDPVPPALILVLVRDLMFASKISGAARALNIAVRMIREPAALRGAEGRRLIADLNQEGAIEAAAAWKAEQGGEVVGFVSHVDTETINKARDAGVDRVLARSQFVQVLDELLQT